MRLPLLQDRHGEPADADQFFLLIHDLYLPDMGRAADMQRRYHPVYKSFLYPADMIGIDLQSDADELPLVYHECRGHAAQGLRQGGRSASMQQSIGLTRTVVHRHFGLQVVFSDLGEFDAEMASHGAIAQGLEFCDRYGRMPD